MENKNKEVVRDIELEEYIKRVVVTAVVITVAVRFMRGKRLPTINNYFVLPNRNSPINYI